MITEILIFIVVASRSASGLDFDRAAYASQKRQMSINEGFMPIQNNSGWTQSILNDDPSPPPVARCTFYDIVNNTGWSFLEIHTSNYYSDNDQHRAAGFCEGALTYQYIFDAYNNFIITVLQGQLPATAQNFISNQLQWMNLKIQQSPFTPYWQVADNVLHQLYGMYDGYLHAINEAGLNGTHFLDFNHFYYLTNMGDLEDVFVAFKGLNQTIMECDAFIKYDKLKMELLSGHSTFNLYSLMLRVHQSYFFEFKNPQVANFNMTFTSRPGDLQSKDDFYILDKNLVVMETSLNNYNASNYRFLQTDTVPCWLRLTIANRLSNSPAEWADNFGFERSGTHNNQWLVVDYKEFNRQKAKGLVKQLQNIVWMIEESFYLYSVNDMTPQLLKNGYIASYNFPVNKTIYDWTNYVNSDEFRGYDYNSYPRTILFKKHAKMGKTTEGLQKLLRLNLNQTDTCDWSLAPRCDLNQVNQQLFGAIDAKVIDTQLLEDGQMWMISGPSNENDLPVFDFTQFPNFTRNGLPDTWNFDWIKWNYNVHKN